MDDLNKYSGDKQAEFMSSPKRYVTFPGARYPYGRTLEMFRHLWQALMAGANILIVRRQGDLAMKFCFSSYEIAHQLAEHSTCPCPVCGDDREYIGSCGEELLPCYHCVGDEPFVVCEFALQVSRPDRLVFIGIDWGSQEMIAQVVSNQRAIVNALGVPPEKLLADVEQAIDYVWNPKNWGKKDKKTLSDKQLIESRRRYLKENDEAD